MLNYMLSRYAGQTPARLRMYITSRVGWMRLLATFRPLPR